ncbi:M23 family metallopeptidase [Salinispora sp. H7-4]|uniref:M23 family metallopeptidase n=1 Tax=Salinispora sp. H7-4 TaxID=2748321 RepID=UPI0015D295F4|nr:M23 family metallopeptidase [Salinispora sp. H7-4]NYT93861.1 M23 family metallopeptidase [Salinispora sp. H7-4]
MEPSPILAILLSAGLVTTPAVPASPMAASSSPLVGPSSPMVGSTPGGGAAPTAAGSRSPGTFPAFQWPLPGEPPVVRRFDPPPQPWLPGHRGVDLAATAGAPVLAAGDGVVTFAGAVAGRPVLTVIHAAGLRTTYEPVHSDVEVGTLVLAGVPIGRLRAGHPGCRAAACLHWGLRRGGTYLDPLALLGRGPVRLLPLDGALR